MEDELICFVCNNSDGKLILFSQETLKKCQTILKARKKHNLKYKDIVLCNEYTEGGYHRPCYKIFTGIKKDHYCPEPECSDKNSTKDNTDSQENTENIDPNIHVSGKLTQESENQTGNDDKNSTKDNTDNQENNENLDPNIHVSCKLTQESKNQTENNEKNSTKDNTDNQENNENLDPNIHVSCKLTQESKNQTENNEKNSTKDNTDNQENNENLDPNIHVSCKLFQESKSQTENNEKNSTKDNTDNQENNENLDPNIHVSCKLTQESENQTENDDKNSTKDNTDNQENNENLDPNIHVTYKLTQESKNQTENEATNNDDQSVCVFCNQKYKKIRGRIVQVREVVSNQFIPTIIAKIEGQDEYTEFINRLKNKIGQKIHYHVECRLAFNYKISSAKKTSNKSDWHQHRECHQIVFNEICNLIKEDVIKKGRCYLLVSLHEMYINSLEKFFEENSIQMNATTFTAHHLEEKIVKTYSKDIKFFMLRNKKIIAPHDLKTIDETLLDNLETENILQKAAFILRKSIMQIEKKKLPDKNITAENLISGEVSIPEQLMDFYFTLLAGSNEKRKKSLKCTRQVHSFCQDVIFGVHNGNVKTSKHIMLGMTLKSLTSSRKIIDIINRYGHCISYQGVEELETEATYTSIEKSSLCPEKIQKNAALFTGVAYDNFDRYVETTTGKDTLHDTVGIIYQNIDLNTTKESEVFEEPATSTLEGPDDSGSQIPLYESNSSKDNETRKRRRRTFETILTEEILYPKKPKMTSDLQFNVDDLEITHLPNTQLHTEVDNIWMISHALNLPDVPMWVGFNSRIYNTDSPQQQISYLTPINASPTNISVVLETMEQCKKIAEDLHQPYIPVTYDLAIAKVAFQIQATEKPKYDNLFIHLGPFHIMMAYFKAIGKVISDCGLTNVMVESNLLANGSVNGFLDGKHFNRCKRLYPLLALGLEILHFESFLQKGNTQNDEMIEDVKRLQTCEISSFEIENEELKELVNNYNIYKKQCLNGEHGKTAQFYMVLINIIHHYLDISRSIRTGSFEQFLSVLPKITNMFFICNQQNYARWTVKYYDNLLKVAQTHPDLYEGFKQGLFGIKRTTKPFSRQPTDLVLEQTINADAARRLTGVIHFTNSISARQRWARSHDVRSTIISQVYLDLGLQSHQDVSAELNLQNIRKNTQQLQEFIATFERFINPFSSQVPKDQLINISSGKSASPPVEKFLLNIEENGDSRRKAFIAECSSDINRFEKPIKKTAIDNFSNDIQQKKKVRVGGKIQEIKIQRDLFGRMLGISMDYNVDISKTLSYPITSVPLSMCHLDGTICKTDKSALMKCLEKEVQHDQPHHIDVLIIDGFFLLHTMKNVPRTFGNISKKMLQMVTQLQAPRIDVIFDQYFTPSIKDFEHSLRLESAQSEYTINGPEQVRPSDFAKELKNSNFKEALVEFFISHWASDEMVPFIRNKIIRINFRKCHYFTVNDSNSVVSSIDDELSCPEHEEADTKIVYHACHIPYRANITIRSVDTDIVVIMLAHMQHLKNESFVWMLTGTGNNLRYVDLTKIHEELGGSFCQSLPGFHAITGCDYNPAFFRKGKLKPYKILKSNLQYQEAFMKFGSSQLYENNCERQNVFDIIQRFICRMYNIGDVRDVNAGRLQMFIDSYKVSNVNEAFNLKKLRKFDASSLPPCKSELQEQFSRSNYICSIWNNAHKKNPTIYEPENNGWVLENEKYTFKWFVGDQLPNDVAESLISDINTDKDDDDPAWSSGDEEEIHL